MTDIVLKEETPVINQEHRAKMMALENAIKRDLPLVELECEHIFAHGTYTRVLHIPKGTVLTGHIHRHSCINIVSKGKIVVATDDGDKELTAPAHFVSSPGVKKAGYALEDTIWINVLPNFDEERDIELIEERALYVQGYEQLEHEQQLKLEEQ